MKFILTAFLLALCLPGIAYSQSTTPFHVSPGLGIGSASGGTGPAFGVNASFQTGAFVISGRALGCQHFELFSDESEGSSDFSLLTGVHMGSDGYLITFEAGIGYSPYTVKYSKTDTVTFRRTTWLESESATGLALQSQLFYRSIGLLVFANFNSGQSLGGALFCVRFGRWT